MSETRSLRNTLYGVRRTAVLCVFPCRVLPASVLKISFPAGRVAGCAPLAYRLYSISPYAYREVKADRTLYWIDVFPEENSTVTETFFVTQEGTFTSPVAEIESLYAPHYRANDRSHGRRMSK